VLSGVISGYVSLQRREQPCAVYSDTLCMLCNGLVVCALIPSKAVIIRTVGRSLDRCVPEGQEDQPHEVDVADTRKEIDYIDLFNLGDAREKQLAQKNKAEF
jgi:hypothetical protein